MEKMRQAPKTAVMWRLTTQPDPEERWTWAGEGDDWLAPGPTPEDAMRATVLAIKAKNESEREWHARVSKEYPDPDRGPPEVIPIPQVMWALPFVPPKVAWRWEHDRRERGEEFENMFDYLEVEVRL